MKILFFGNCQTEVVMAALAHNNPGLELEYAGNSNRVAKYDPQRTERLMDWCDHIITQPVLNADNPDHHSLLRQRFADKITFMPYIWIDGLFSLCGLPENRLVERQAGYIGQNLVIGHLDRVGFVQGLQDFRAGMIDFQHLRRFESSLDELTRREAFADVRIASFLRENFRERVVMLTHNHPHPIIVNDITRQIAGRLGLRHNDIQPANHAAYADITLPEFGKVFSPYVVADLGLRHDPDPQWFRQGQEIITRIADGIEGLPDRPSQGQIQTRSDDRRGLIAERQAQTGALRASIEEVKAQNEALRAQNAERQAMIAERQAQVEGLAAANDAQKVQNEALRAQNAARQALIAERQAQNEVLKAQITEKQALIARREEQKAEVLARNAVRGRGSVKIPEPPLAPLPASDPAKD